MKNAHFSLLLFFVSFLAWAPYVEAKDPKAKASPSQKEHQGKRRFGVEVKGIGEQGFLHDLGLRNGDFVLRMNDTPIFNLTDFMNITTLYAENLTSLKVELLRGGKKVTLNSKVPRSEFPWKEIVLKPKLNKPISDEEFAKARFVPNFRNGHVHGHRVFGIRKNSTFQKIGLRNGDAITEINGVQSDKDGTFLSELKKTKSLKIKILRKVPPSK